MARGYSYRTGVVLLDQWRQLTPGASLQPVVSDRATGAEESDDQIVAGRQAVRDGNGAEVLRRWLSTRRIEMFAQENYGGRRPSVRSVERRGVSPHVRDENRATAVGQASLQFGD